MKKINLLLASLIMSGTALATPVSQASQHVSKHETHSDSLLPETYYYNVNVYTISKDSPLYNSYKNLTKGLTEDFIISADDQKKLVHNLSSNMVYYAPGNVSVNQTQTYIKSKETKIIPAVLFTTDSHQKNTQVVVQTTLTPGTLNTGINVGIQGKLVDGQIMTNILWSYSPDVHFNPAITFDKQGHVNLPNLKVYDVKDSVHIPIGKTYYSTIKTPEEIQILTVKFNKQ